MMQACEQWVQAHDVLKIQLMVRTDTQAAVVFYEQLSYIDAEVIVLGRRLDGAAP